MRDKEQHATVNFQIDPKHYGKHNFLTYCNDVLVSILKYVDAERLSSAKIDFKNQVDAEAFAHLDTDSDDWQGWLAQNGYGDVLYEVYYRHTLFSLVGDFCHYMLESINCAAKMNVAVSYALLRKPLKDTLGYIEWLYVDRKGMLDLLMGQQPEQLEISKERARLHTSIIEEQHSKETFFDFRYDKSNISSLEHIWNNANHLLTTKYKLSKTQPGNLNFIFADEPILRHYSDYYYLIIPAIMGYATEIICEMFEAFAPINGYTLAMNQLNRTVRLVETYPELDFAEVRSLYADTKLPLICPRCGLKMKMTDRRMWDFFFRGTCTCWRCRKKINTGRYIFDWEKINFIFEE